MSRDTSESAPVNTIYSFHGIPPAGQLIPLGLQHVVAAVVGVITPAIIISGVCGLDAAQKTLLIQASLVMTAIATLLQLFPIEFVPSAVVVAAILAIILNLTLPKES